MARRSKISARPSDIRSQLDKFLAEGQRNHESLSLWLKDQGYEISRSAVQRHDRQFEQRLDAIRLAAEEARAIVAAAPDDEASINDALTRLVQSQLQHALIELKMDTPDLTRIARAVADLGRTAVGQKRWASEVRVRLEKQKAAAGETIGKIAREGGLSDDAEAAIRAALFSINPLPGAASSVTA